MNSIFFGRSPKYERFGKANSTTVPSSIKTEVDNVWRQKGDPASFHWGRWKLLLNVTCNDYVEMHYFSTNRFCQTKDLWSANPNDLRFNHYKLSQNGVYAKH